MEPESVARFREYLQINSMHPNPDYASCAKFLKRQAEEIGLEFKTYECVPEKPIVIMKWPGTNPNLRPVILNSHMDVVPVFEEFWNYPPFGAERVPTPDGDFRIYARGSQDMKIVGSCYLEAIRSLKAAGKTPKRTMILMYVPDEETGGVDGMRSFVETEEFKNINAEFALDEGIANTGPELYAYYSERSLNQVKFTAHGNTGHGSQFIPDTAISRIMNIANELLALRDKEENKLVSLYGNVDQKNLGEATAINLTMFNGGVQANVVPESFTAYFDIRVTPNQNLAEFNTWLKQLAEKNHADLEFLGETYICPITDTSDNNPFWVALSKALDNKGLEKISAIFPAGTDSRFLRRAGVPAIGISPLRNHPVLLHDHDEYVTESQFLEGIDMYISIIHELGNVE
ncbi:hypothetical protein BB558_001999 [Smittium angustum]|uniref:Peptidase M20 dimerisation domain-containing protein n=1 Tax=Smittium angustum TaxID=133377 RepID=A0A2U1JA95_SMIAN|nr:hypothetical protein BB558_001999 [Smittium angustum]